MIEGLLAQLRCGETSPRALMADALVHANSNAGKNVYIALDPDRAVREAEGLPSKFTGPTKPSLYGLPISLKDLFDLAGYHTSCGSRYHAGQSGVATQDSAVAARLRTQGAAIVGKTHLHRLAYGITGENPDYGDCAQPRDATRLTGGSSSGAVASVQEGSAVAAIGTDTGGSIRVPAALCSLAGYRASINLAQECDLWRGGVHLAQSFDTLGWLFRDLGDGPLLAEALFGLPPQTRSANRFRIARVSAGFLRDCDPTVIGVFEEWQKRLAEVGAEIVAFDSDYWEDATEIFAPIQANEAAAILIPRLGGDLSRVEPLIGGRLAWGASLDPSEVKRQRRRHAEFRERIDTLLGEYDFIILPCSPVARLNVSADHSQVRPKILRYTAPMSLAGAPVVTLPHDSGAGVQLCARRGSDACLLAFAATLATKSN